MVDGATWQTLEMISAELGRCADRLELGLGFSGEEIPDDQYKADVGRSVGDRIHALHRIMDNTLTTWGGKC